MSANVIGEIRGREKPEEIVLLGAHLDSWDLGAGAQDDGAGVGIVLETARQILAAKEPPRRTIRFVLFANEENGLRGGTAYAQAHKAELEKHVLALEADGGDGQPTGLSYLGGPEQAAAAAPIAALLAPLGVGAPEAADHHGADLTPLRAAAVPMVHVLQDVTHYFDWHHSADDTYDKIRPDQLARATAAFATVTYAAADSPSSFGRVPEPPPQPPATKQ
jgi:Zn-dependent M28 family amino/carboxypeptidase